MSEKLEEKTEKKTRTKFKSFSENTSTDKPVQTTIKFRDRKSREDVEKFYKVLGFKNLNDYIMSVIFLSMTDEDVSRKLKQNKL